MTKHKFKVSSRRRNKTLTKKQEIKDWNLNTTKYNNNRKTPTSVKKKKNDNMNTKKKKKHET